MASKRSGELPEPADVAGSMMQTGLAFFDPRKLLDEEQWALSHFRDFEKVWLDEVKKSSESFMALTTKMRAAQHPAEAMTIYMAWLQEQAAAMPATAQRMMQMWAGVLGAAIPGGREADGKPSSPMS